MSRSNECEKCQQVLKAFGRQVRVAMHFSRARTSQGFTKIRVVAANIQSSASLSGSGQSNGSLISSSLS